MSATPGLATAQQHALDALRWMIVSGSLRPGERVNQDEVAGELELSIAPVREALRVLEQEGQVTYRPRRGYFVTELHIDDLREIYDLRALLEERAVRRGLPLLDEEVLERMTLAAGECAQAASRGDIARELEANRRFHFALLATPDEPHALRVMQLLWDSTEPYRAMYYNSPQERDSSLRAHERILDAVRARDVERAVAELDLHRHEALEVLGRILGESDHGEGHGVGNRGSRS